MITIKQEVFKHGSIGLYRGDFGNYILAITYHRTVRGEFTVYSYCETFDDLFTYEVAMYNYFCKREYLGELIHTTK